LDQFVSGNRPGGFRRFLHPLVGALCRRKLRLGLQAIGLGRLKLRLCFGDLRGHFGSAQFHQQVSLLNHAAAIHQHALYITRNFGMQVHRKVR